MPALRLPLPELAEEFLVRRDIAFLNHGSFGACPRPVFATYQRWQHELERQPVEFLGRRLGGLLSEARDALAAYIGAAPARVVFVTNATFGVNIVARALRLEPGDEVLATDHEYGAAERSWRFNCERQGAVYRTVALDMPAASQAELAERIWAGVTERTRVIFMSHITSPTALILPVAEVCRRAREAGILTLIDGAHAPGHVDLALDALGADFYTGNCHKWLCAPKGAGFLYARPEVQAILEPLVVSWGWRAEKPGPSPFLDYFEWPGTYDPAAPLSVPAAIAFQAEHNWPAVREACHALAQEARARVAALTGEAPLSPDGPEWYGQMVACPIPLAAPDDLQQRLWSEHGVEVPCTACGGRRFVRVSVQAYTRPEEIDRLLEGLEAILSSP